MNIWMIFKVSILAILRNKTRSLLTCIGIIVGIAAVIAVLAIGKGASTMMVKEISSMGNNLVMVWPDWNRRGTVRAGMGAGQTMTAGDAEAIVRELGHLVGAVSPAVNVSAQLVRQNRNWNVRVSGVSCDMPEIRNWQIAEGRFFEESEQRNNSRVCVIGTTVRGHLFDDEEEAVGRTIRIGAMPFKIVGVLASKGANGWGQDQDDTVMAPYTTVARVLQRSKFRSINMMNVSLHSMDDVEEAKREITSLLRQRHKLAGYQDDDFVLRDTKEIMSTIQLSEEAIQAYFTGMQKVAHESGGTAYKIFKNYPINICAKTGTADAGTNDVNAAFMCFAPAEDPEIVIAIYGENAGHGSAVADIAKAILDAYFEIGDSADVDSSENQVS